MLEALGVFALSLNQDSGLRIDWPRKILSTELVPSTLYINKLRLVEPFIQKP